MQVINPANQNIIAHLPEDDAASIREKYERARAAQPEWAARPLDERCAAIRRFADRLADEKERLAVVLSNEVGKPIRQARNEIQGTLGRIDFFLAHVEAVLAPEIVFDDSGQALRERITHEPLGVVANISAWNYPYFVGGNVFVPALLAGNAVLYKPSEFAALTGLAITGLLHEAGVPTDIFAAVTGEGTAGARLAEQPVDGVFFTGSYATGTKIAAAVASRMIRLQLELGGKDPVYVCDDVDIGKTAAGVADGAFYNTGQSCCAVERIYVHHSIHDRFVEAFVAEVKGYRMGDPLDEETYLGPLTRRAQLEVLERHTADAIAKGATLETGGKRMAGEGNYFEPTVLTGVDHTMAVMREESFGPIIGIQAAASDEEAGRLMNDTEYGLTAAVYTPDQQRAERILRGVRSGSAYWNCCDRVSPRLPWSGVGHSGVGVTLSTQGIRAFTRPRAWHLRG